MSIEKVIFPQEESWYPNLTIIEDALEFFNCFFKLKEHPFTVKDIESLGNFQFALKIEAVVWKSFKLDEQLYYRINPLEFWKNLIKNMSRSHYIIFQKYLEIAFRSNCHTLIDYGGGSGMLAYLFACYGFDVTFAEVNYLSLCWMRYLRVKRNIKMNIIDLTMDPLGKYDLVICKDVLEHVVDPEVLMEKLKGLTLKQLLVAAQNTKEEDWLPMHHDMKVPGMDIEEQGEETVK